MHPGKTNECPLILGTISSISIGSTSEPTIVFFRGFLLVFRGGKPKIHGSLLRRSVALIRVLGALMFVELHGLVGMGWELGNSLVRLVG